MKAKLGNRPPGVIRDTVELSGSWDDGDLILDANYENGGIRIMLDDDDDRGNCRALVSVSCARAIAAHLLAQLLSNNVKEDGYLSIEFPAVALFMANLEQEEQDTYWMQDTYVRDELEKAGWIPPERASPP